MAGITGMGTTFNLPNFVGDLFNVSPEDTPLLSRIGGLTGGREATDKTFEWEFYDLRDPDGARQKLEGANAPDSELRVRSNASNVLEIHQEAVDISYTRLSVGARGGYGTTQRGTSPVGDEMAWQMDQQLKQVARDVNYGFINGVYAKPADNLTPRKTRGIFEAIVTNVKDMGGTAPDEEDILDLFQIAYQNGGIQEGETRTILCGPAMKRYLTKILIRDKDLEPDTRHVSGVTLTTIETDFGRADIMVDRAVPAGQLAVLSLEQLAPRFLLVPGKGHFFWEPLAKIGASERSQLYGEIGLEYGNERNHAKLVDATTPFDSVGSGSGS